MNTLDLSTIRLDGPIPFPPWVEDLHADVSSIKNVPRPRNKFFIYRNHWTVKLRTLKSERSIPMPEPSQKSLSKMISIEWAALDTEARRPYAEAAEREKAAHRVVWPGWKYTPVSKAAKAAEKVAAKAEKEAERSRQEGERRATGSRASRPAPYTVPPRGRHRPAMVPIATMGAPGAPLNAQAGPSQWNLHVQHPPAPGVGLFAPAAWMPAPLPLPQDYHQHVDRPLPVPESVEEEADEFGHTAWPHPYDELQWVDEWSCGDY